MITHYLKVALRNLLKYKAHSFISAICLAIGITCFCLTNYFIDIVTAQTDLPDYERRISLACCSEDTAADIYWKLDDIRYLDEQSITGMDSLVTASFLAIQKSRSSTRTSKNCLSSSNTNVFPLPSSPIRSSVRSVEKENSMPPMKSLFPKSSPTKRLGKKTRQA